VSARLLAAGLFTAALLLYLGVAIPSQRLAASAADEYKRARDERRDIRARLLKLERRDATRRRVASVIQSSPASAEETVRLVRRSVVQTLVETGIAGARLGVRPGRPPAGAAVRLSAEGGFADVMRLAERLARPDMGIVLQEVRLRAGSSGAAVDIQGLGFGIRP